MAKWQIDAMLDAALTYLSGAAIEFYVCNGQPANYAGIAAMALTGAVNCTGDFTGPGDYGSGRNLTVDEQLNIPITASDDATHIVLASADTLLYITTCTLQALTSGGTVTVPSWDIEISDAT